MPFASEKQRRYLWTNEPAVAQKFADEEKRMNQTDKKKDPILDQAQKDLEARQKKRTEKVMEEKRKEFRKKRTTDPVDQWLGG